MNKNQTILDLIQGADVEWKPLADVTEYEQPSKYLVKSTKYSDEFKTPVLTAGKTFILGYTDETDGIKNASVKSVILFDDFTSATRWIDFDFKVKSSATKFITSKNESELLPKFLYYWLMTLQNVEVYAAEHKRLWISNFSQTKIPIPSLEIQQKVVEILDKMTDYVTELTAELTLRKKQYAYYRDQLLTFPSQSDSDESASVKWLTLEEVAKKISSGGTPKTGTKEYYDGDIPWLRTQEVNFGEIWETGVKITEAGVKNSSAKWIPENCVIVAMYGATVGKIGINKIPMTTNQACANIELDETKANYRYVFHYLTSKYEYIKSLGTGSQTNINAQIVKNLKIPVPALSEQKRIVEILDKFDKLTSDLSEGLPREIELRQNQYEYWREQLLSFKKE